MNNNNGMPGNAELIALANRRREQLKKAEEERRRAAEQQAQPRPQTQTRPQPQPQPRPQPRPQPQPQPRPQPRPDDAERARRAAEEARRRQAEEAKKLEAEARAKAEAEKRKKSAEERIARDKAAAEKRKRREERAQAREERLAAFRKEYKGIFKDAVGYFAVFICLILILCAASAAFILIRMLNYGEPEPLPERITLTIDGKSHKFDYGELVRDGIYYVNFQTIASLCRLSQSGDKTVTIYSAPCGEQIRFATPPARTVLINGNAVTAEREYILIGDDLWVPLSLISEYFLGIDVTVTEGKDAETEVPFIKISISRTEEGDGYAEVSFLLKTNHVINGISNITLPEEPVTLPDDAPQYEFAADISHYLKYMCPEDYNKHMILVNPSHPVDETYIPENLVGVPNPRHDNDSVLCEDASLSLEALFLEMHALGFRDMKVSIAYRSYEQQKYQFDVYVYNERYYYRSHYETEGKWFSDEAYATLGKTYLEEKYISQGKTSLSADDAKRVAMSYSAYPGTGDHQTGLALDLYLPGYSGLKFAETEEYKWLVENAYKFGFIFRYPEDKENITGYSFEPVHLRFVGQYHASLIHESGLALEEYVAKYID